MCNIVSPFLQLLPRHAHTHTHATISTISCLSFWFGSTGLLPPVGKQAPHTPPTFCPANCNQPASQRSPYTPKILLRGHTDWYKIFPLSPQKVATSVMQQFVQYIYNLLRWLVHVVSAKNSGCLGRSGECLALNRMLTAGITVLGFSVWAPFGYRSLMTRMVASHDHQRRLQQATTTENVSKA